MTRRRTRISISRRGLVEHIDSHAIAAVERLYRELLPPGGDVLDLMSSWVSHLPPETGYGRVVGLGMNASELAANGRLSSYVVHDLNADPQLPFETASFDAVVICVSIQYLTRAPRGAARSRAGRAPWGPGGYHVLESLLPDESRRDLADARRWRTSRTRKPLSRASRWLGADRKAGPFGTARRSALRGNGASRCDAVFRRRINIVITSVRRRRSRTANRGR